MTKSTEYRQKAEWVKQTAKELASPNMIVTLQCAEREVKLPAMIGKSVDDKVMAYGYEQGKQDTINFIRNMAEPFVEQQMLESKFQPPESPKKR